MSLLKREAKGQNTSVNSLIIRMIEQGIGYSKKSKKTRFHDLDNLAGMWSAADCKAFEENTKLFETIDKELWQ
ncbi:MAG: hypothetical protein LLG04_11415 [Parachlamydia sp.]|nr:hypothetical protein [Parachlamydia sp.]